MSLTPEDIQTQQFHVRFRGFDVEEVDSFLEKVAEAYLALVEENKTLNAKLEELAKEMATYHNQEKTFQNAILSAQNIAEEMKEKSRQEAEELLSKAREETKQLREDANAEVAGLEKEVDRLRDLKTQAQRELRQLLQSYLEQLESESGDFSSFDDPVSASEDDLSDLYQKIDLSDDLLDAASQEEDMSGEEETEASAYPDEEESQSAMPDLNGDMLFTLEDPLEEHGPVVDLGNEETPSDKQG